MSTPFLIGERTTVSLPQAFAYKAVIDGHEWGLTVAPDEGDCAESHFYRASIVCDGRLVVDAFTRYGKARTAYSAKKMLYALAGRMANIRNKKRRRQAAKEAAE